MAIKKPGKALFVGNTSRMLVIVRKGLDLGQNLVLLGFRSLHHGLFHQIVIHLEAGSPVTSVNGCSHGIIS